MLSVLTVLLMVLAVVACFGGSGSSSVGCGESLLVLPRRFHHTMHREGWEMREMGHFAGIPCLPHWPFGSLVLINPQTADLHSSSQLVTDLHSSPQLFTDRHRSPQLFTDLHSSSQIVTDLHSSSQISTALHRSPLKIEEKQQQKQKRQATHN